MKFDFSAMRASLGAEMMESRMKVLHLAGNPEDAGGILSVIRHVQTATQPKGWRHCVFVHRRYMETRRPSLEYRYSRFVCSEMPSHWGIFWRASLAWLELRRLLARESFDIVHAHSRCGFMVALWLAASSNRRVLFTNHDHARRVSLYRRASGQRNFFTVLLTPNMARHYGLEERPPKINVISACCSDQFFSEPLAHGTSALSNGQTLRLVGVGSMLRWKKWDLLLQALRQLSESERRRIEVSIWGPIVRTDPDSPKYDAELRQSVREQQLQDCVFLRGPTSAMSGALRKADWFILPSTNEPCSVALIEALALGLPALVSASGGNIDIVRDRETGLFFKPGDAVDFAEKMRAILDSEVPVWAPEKIRESVRARSASAVGEKYHNLYQCLIPANDNS